MGLNVAITGVGVVSALGHRPQDLYDRLTANEIAITETPWTRDDPDRTEWWAPVLDLEPPEWMLSKLAGIDPFAQSAGAAATRALGDAGLDHLDPLRTGIVLGTAKNGTQTLERAQFDVDRGGRGAASGKTQIQVWPNMAAAQVAMHWGIHGPALTLSTACASSLDAVGLGARMVSSGLLDVAIVGGAEGGLSSRVWTEDGFVPASAYARYAYGMGAKVTDARTACMPFDAHRAGMVFGEGAGVFILESAERAAARGAQVYGYVEGWGSVADATHPSTPEQSGVWERRAMELALEEAGIDGSALDMVAAHGTGTPKGDIAEIRALNDLLGTRAGDVKVSSVKGTLGHPTGAAGAIALVASLEGLRRGSVIHTGGTTTADPEIRFDLVMEQPRVADVEWFQVNAFGFGGQNASLTVRAAR